MITRLRVGVAWLRIGIAWLAVGVARLRIVIAGLRIMNPWRRRVMGGTAVIGRLMRISSIILAALVGNGRTGNATDNGPNDRSFCPRSVTSQLAANDSANTGADQAADDLVIIIILTLWMIILRAREGRRECYGP